MLRFANDQRENDRVRIQTPSVPLQSLHSYPLQHRQKAAVSGDRQEQTRKDEGNLQVTAGRKPETWISSTFWDFPGGPVVTTLYSEGRGPGFYPWSGNTIPHATTKTQHISVQSLSRIRLFAMPWTAACPAFLSITNSQSLLKLMSAESVMLSNHLSVVPFSSCLQ